MLTAKQVEIHRHGIGGSEGAAIMGLHPFMSPLDVYLKKTGQKPEGAGNRFTKWGNKLEAVVAEAYGEESGCRIIEPTDDEARALVPNLGPHGEIVDPDRPYLIGFPDRIILDEKRGAGILECKTTAGWKRGDWAEDIPLHHQVQHQHYLYLSGLTWGAVAVLIGGNEPKWLDAERSEQFLVAYVPALERFWNEHVVPRIPPPIDPSKDAQNVAALYAVAQEGVVDLPDDLLAVANEFEEVKAQLSELEKRKKELDTKLKAGIGANEAGRFSVGWGYTWKNQHREESIIPACDFRVLRKAKKL